MYSVFRFRGFVVRESNIEDCKSIFLVSKHGKFHTSENVFINEF